MDTGIRTGMSHEVSLRRVRIIFLGKPRRKSCLRSQYRSETCKVWATRSLKLRLCIVFKLHLCSRSKPNIIAVGSKAQTSQIKGSFLYWLSVAHVRSKCISGLRLTGHVQPCLQQIEFWFKTCTSSNFHSPPLQWMPIHLKLCYLFFFLYLIPFFFHWINNNASTHKVHLA